jgi:hypothetical protein
LSQILPNVKAGETLERASVIGSVDEKLIFQVTQDGSLIDPIDLIGLERIAGSRYIEACDLNQDAKSEYDTEDIKKGLISPEDALKEINCTLEALKKPKKHYMKSCDFNNDGITDYDALDVTQGYVSKKDALKERYCVLRRVKEILRAKRFEEWLIANKYKERFFKAIKESNDVAFTHRVSCIYGLENKFKNDTKSAEYNTTLEACIKELEEGK